MSTLVAGRFTVGNLHPGSGLELRIRARSLRGTSVLPDDLLVATEWALTDAVSGCCVRLYAIGSSIAHASGHMRFANTRRSRAEHIAGTERRAVP